ncbi:unnamed protein product [Penicillium salamii]|uniref:Pentatricopeptide repeat protein n=1 Tax=Penicillium salamii TaxID=1612424 RepID=A0A9W4NZ25_9EURO|nr:unnamed protein product [Penicillium salamii]CAG8045475.1 unnamed protein product [Penicillium salamii]CAG8108792.1 unnamed protein product [Penicillium salamii]CAG8141929.1 unnamed protein product [Penicillium salamii]CAG8175633.1 unnamed protein product [Penicillium salamii]
MSLGVRKIARSRLNGLLSPCRAQQWHQGFGTLLGQRARLSALNTPVALDSRMGPDAATSSTFRPPSHDLFEPHPPTRQLSQPSATHLQDTQDGQSQPDPHKHYSTSTLPMVTGRKIRALAMQYNADPRLVHRAATQVNRGIQLKNKILTDRGLFLSLAIRLNSLYSRTLAYRQWKGSYTAIFNAKLDGGVVHRRLPSLNDDAKYLLDMVLDDCYGSFQETWEDLNRPTKAWAWQRLAIWLLQNAPEKALDFLIVTTKPLHKPDANMVSDCFIYLDRFYYHDWLRGWSSDTHTYATAIADCMQPEDWPIINPPQRGLRLYIRRTDSARAVKAFRLVNERGITMEAQTLLCFMNKFTHQKNVELALKALGSIPRINHPDFTMASSGVLRHCCKLLTLDSVEDTAEGRNFRILPRLLNMNVQPDRDMMNLVLANAYKTGDPQLGADMLDFMQRHHHVFDSYTYVTLLTDAVARGDHSRVDELTREIETQEQFNENPYIFSKLMHAHYTFTAKHLDPESDPAGVFYSMLEMYNKLHDISPLKALFIVPSHYTPPVTGLQNKIPPSRVALFLMISTFFRCKNKHTQAHRIYDQFRELVRMGDPSIAPLVETDHVYNEFLIAFRKSPLSLRSSVRLVEDMLDTSTLPTHTTTGVPLKHVAPSKHTWTILLSAFNYNGQPDAAEKVKEMMAKYNVRYNQVTWNTIINGFANTQSITETASAIRQMEQQGFVIDRYTMNSLRYLRDPQRLWDSVAELDKASANSAYEEPLATEPTPDVHTGLQELEHDDLIDSGLQKLELKSKSSK